MPLTRKQFDELKKRGLSDEQISKFAAGEKPAPVYTGAPDLPLEDPGLLDPLNLPNLMPAGMATGRLVPPLIKAVGRSIPATGQAIGRRLLNKGIFDDAAKKVLGPITKPQTVAKTAKAATKATKATKPSITRGVPKNAKPATPVTKPVAKVAAKPKAVSKPARPPITKPHRPRGASAPELARRTAARAKAVGKSPPAMGDQNIEALLAKSVALEEEMAMRGLDEATKVLLRQMARAGGF